ncbi:MAG: glycosyltransferase family 9 protein [Abitibacteriaceae bacterium]|nr:glycosyltransferase family 9 protein [Abditibacteriaceae bacterium]
MMCKQNATAPSQNSESLKATCQTAPSSAVISTSTAAAAVLSPSVAAANISLTVPVQRIVTLHMNGLGDLLFTMPALFALREAFPGANICAVVRPALAPLLQGSPLVDDVLLRPKGGLSAQASLMAKLHARHIDVAVAFSGSRNTTMLAWSTGASVRAGFADARMDALLTHLVSKVDPPTIEAHLDLVRALGCPTRKHDYGELVPITPTARQQADALLKEQGIQSPFIMVACEASEKRGIKEWPEEHWVAALDKLAARWPVVLVGTRPTPSVTSHVTNRVIDLGGRTDLPTLAALCGQARLFIGIDSGVLHLAAAMRVPVVGIYGPTDWCRTGPRGVPHRIVRHPVECSPCLLAKCKWTGEDERKCLTRIDPDAVVIAAKELIGV